MTADPVAPGRGLPVYQPVTVVLVGTWRVPFRLRPRLMIGALTPMAGMVSQTGLGVGSTTDSETGDAVGPDGTATCDGRAAASRAADAAESRATTRPAVPAPAASSPALSMAADSIRACARHAADAQPSAPGRRATRRPLGAEAAEPVSASARAGSGSTGGDAG